MTTSDAIKADYLGSPEININPINGLKTARILSISFSSDDFGNQVYNSSYAYETIVD